MTSEDKPANAGDSQTGKKARTTADEPEKKGTPQRQARNSEKHISGDASGTSSRQSGSLPQKPPRQKIKSARGPAWVALLLAVAALAGIFFNWKNGVETGQRLESRIAAINDELQNKASQARAAQINNRIAEIDKKVEDDAASVESVQNTVQEAIAKTSQLGESLEALHAEMTRGRKNDWLVAEAEYLMSLANQHIKLDGNTQVALAALQAADQRLRETGDPSLVNIRGIIANEATALQSVEQADATGFALILSSLEDRVEQLTLPGRVRHTAPELDIKQDEEDESDWMRAAWNAWDALKSLVVVRHDGTPRDTAPLLAPQEATYLYQNLRLKLESARLALIQGNEPLFHDSLKNARKWIERYFTDSGEKSSMLTSLKRLDKTKLSPELPDISRSLKALREWSHNQKSGKDTANTRKTLGQRPQEVS